MEPRPGRDDGFDPVRKDNWSRCKFITVFTVVGVTMLLTIIIAAFGPPMNDVKNLTRKIIRCESMNLDQYTDLQCARMVHARRTRGACMVGMVESWMARPTNA